MLGKKSWLLLSESLRDKNWPIPSVSLRNPTKEQSFPSAGNVSSSSIWRSLALSAEEWASGLREGTASSHLLSATFSLWAEF